MGIDQDGNAAVRRAIDESRASLATGPESSGAATIEDSRRERALKAEAAREIYTQRRRRAVLFGNPDLFGEPAWDILLDLYIAEVEGKAVSVSSACIGSAAPPTTGLRWLGVLAENNLILREHDPEDQRRVLVRLTDSGLAAMDQFFSGI
ncbi:MarR family transcriptional regulator [Qipengyuania sp. ASV99]|uniref:MarR family transcriptional regulator n=1 Tax=Qipengyuania sp. ASV99 TaxID=3399681 RepID=UPI003A4C8350